MCAFTSCSSWANCNFPQHEQCLYDDNTVPEGYGGSAGSVPAANYCGNYNECIKQQQVPPVQQQVSLAQQHHEQQHTQTQYEQQPLQQVISGESYYQQRQQQQIPTNICEVPNNLRLQQQQQQQQQQQNQQQQYYGALSTANEIYGNTSPSNEQAINLNTFYPCNEEQPRSQAPTYGAYRNNNTFGHNNNNNIENDSLSLRRHHPYQRASSTYQNVNHQTQQHQQPQQQVHTPQNAATYFQQLHHNQPNATLYGPHPARPHQAIYYANSAHGGPPQSVAASGSEFERMPRVHIPVPCHGNQPWSYDYCYGYAHPDQEPCQYTQFIDIEDFMNNEKRKEKSRDAARCRRSRETEIFTDLAQVLPLKKEDVNQLDKASVMRLAIAYLKIRDMLNLFPKLKMIADKMSSGENSFLMAEHESDSNASSSTLKSTESTVSEPSNVKEGDLLETITTSQLIKQTIDGFLIILSNDGDITYVTDNVTDYLGIAKIDILGQQIWEYTHQCDHAELKEALNIKRIGLADKIKDEHMPEEGLSTDHRDLYVRFKCTLTSRGRSINIKSASYKVIHMTGHLVVNRKGDRVFVAIGRPIPHPSNIEIPLESSTFLTKHSLDMKFTYVDEKMLNLIGYEADDLLEKSLFDCHHGEDSESLMATFKDVLSKGQAETCRYRFLGKTGGYCWIVTQATLVYDKMKPQSVVCVNYVISQLENNNEIYSLAQYEASQKKLDSKNEENNSNNNIQQAACIDDKPTQQQQQQQEQAIKQEPETSIKTLCKQSNPTTIDNNTSVSTPSITTTPPPPNDKPTKPATPPTTIRVPAATPPPQPQTSIKREKCPTAQLYCETGSNATTVAATCPVVPLVRDLHQTKLTSRPVALPPSSISSLKTLHIEENRPKSVTASVFRPNPQAVSNNALVAEPIGPFVDLPKTAATVTASVFTPISQLPANAKFNTHLVKSTTATASILGQQQQQPPQQQQQLQQQDMNKGFLSFPEDATELTMLKEEPDDLVHLGQSPIVDACMPLDETNSLFSDVLVGFIGSYGANLLNDDINSLDSTASSSRTTGSPSIQNCNYNATGSNCSSPASLMQQQHQQQQQQHQSCSNNNGNNNNNNKGVNIDPLINYRDQSNDTSCSPQHLLSPTMAAKSPDGSSLPSLCSPDSLSHEDEFAFMSMNVNDEIELSMRAPYIPMNEQEDLPLLTDDLMWCSSSSFSEELSMHKDSDSLHLQLPSHHQSQQQSQQHHQQQHNQHTHQQQQLGDILSYSHQQQFTSNSLCSSPASTVSSMSPSPVHSQMHHHQQQQQQQHDSCSNTVFGDSSELAALLCGAGNGTLSILSGVSNGGGIKDDASANHGNSNTNGGVIDGGGNLVVNRKSQTHCSQLGDSLSSDDFRMQLQQQHQQQQSPQLLGLSINCKKEKYENSLGASSMCDPIEDAFVYGKVSNNLDCWSELLQITVNDNSTASTVSPATDSTAAPSPSTSTTTSQIDDLQQQNCKTSLDLQQQQQQHQQNVLLNAMPLTTIQSNKNIMLQQQQHQQQQQQTRSNNTTQKLLISEEILSGGNRSSAIHNSTGSAGKVTTIKLINGGSAALTPVTTTATIRVVESKVPQQQRQQNQKKNATLVQAIAASAPSQQHGNKRHSTSSSGQTQTERKRLKSATTAAAQQQQQQQQQPPPSTTKTVELLQQLVATSSSQAKSSPTMQRKSLWPTADGSPLAKRQLQQQQRAQEQSQSHSVLKNLLISGCDNVLNIITKPEEMLIDDSSMQSPCISPYPKPMGETATAGVSVLRNSRNNPMIGGTVSSLPSPSFGPRDDDSNPPGLTACDTDTASDSGIDDISLGETGTPMKIAAASVVAGDFGGLLLKYPQMEGSTSLAATFTDDCDLAGSFEAASAALPDGSSSSAKAPLAAFMDTDDSPLLTPPLPMDLWNEPAFLTDTAFDYGLNEWAH